MNVLYDVQYYQACMSMTRSIIAAWASSFNAIALLLVLRDPTSIKHVCACPVFALTSHHRVLCSSGLKQLAEHHWHVTSTPCKAPKKAVEGATALF